MARTRLVVIGNGMGGHHLLEQLVEQERPGNLTVTVIGKESHIADDRVHLSEVFQGSGAGERALSTQQQHADWGFDPRLNRARKRHPLARCWKTLCALRLPGWCAIEAAF